MNQRMITRSNIRSKESGSKESAYVIYKNAFQRNDDVLEACKKLAKHKNMGPIFQTKTYKDTDSGSNFGTNIFPIRRADIDSFCRTNGFTIDGAHL
jgi:hypothetical protein